MTTVCLAMLLKDEGETLARALSHLRGMFDSAVFLVDDRTTDGTVEAVHTELRKSPRCAYYGVEMCDRHDRDFGALRSRLTKMAQAEGCEFTLMLDGDDQLLTPPPGGFGAEFDGSKDCYSIWIDDQGWRYRRKALFRSRLPWRYEMPAHEYLVNDEGEFVEGDLTDCVIIRGADDRHNDKNRYSGDAARLATFLGEHPRHCEGWYYYAQSLRDCGALEGAANAYGHRATLGGWDEQVYSALLERAKCMERLVRPGNELDFAKVHDAYIQAHAFRPTRPEALRHAARFSNESGKFGFSEIFANGLPRNGAGEILRNGDTFFIEEWCYR